MLTLDLKVNSDLSAPILAPAIQQGLGNGVPFLRRKWAKARHQFKPVVELASRAEAEQLVGLLRYLQGDTPVWYDGADYGDIQNPILIGYGDRVTTHVFLPHDNVFSASLVVYVNGVVNSDWTLTESTGLLIFGTALAADAVITAKYQWRAKCFIEGVSDPLISYDRQSFGRYKITVTLREMPQAA
jgi:hypothetical protein